VKLEDFFVLPNIPPKAMTSSSLVVSPKIFPQVIQGAQFVPPSIHPRQTILLKR
jgi:hypothetical protein